MKGLLEGWERCVRSKKYMIELFEVVVVGYKDRYEIRNKRNYVSSYIVRF